jgi:PPM family protein phosphatase
MSEPSVRSKFVDVSPADVDTVTLPGVLPPLGVSSFGLTDPGKVRTTNEDQYLIAALVKALQVQSTSLPRQGLRHSSDRSYLFMVADGMGGHAGGEEASALAIDSVESFVLESFKWFSGLKGAEQDRVLEEFKSALSQANAQVFSVAAQRPELRGMGTTLTLDSLNDDLFVAHVGDSRCYLFRGGQLVRLTRDHTLVEELVRRGVLTAAEAANHRSRHVITNAVGGAAANVKVEVHKVSLEAADVVLLCSDGLTNMVSDEAISRLLRDEPDPERASRRLVASANAAGGKDHITVIVALFERVGKSAPAPAGT